MGTRRLRVRAEGGTLGANLRYHPPMNLRWLAPFAVVPLVAWAVARRTPQATELPLLQIPVVVTLEGAPESGSTDVIVRGPGDGSRRAVFGRVVHEPGSARHAVAWSNGVRRVVWVTVADAGANRHSTYNSALHRVERGTSVRVLGGLTDASSPLVTETGNVIVQRGRDGVEPDTSDGRRVLREQVDDLALDALDPDTSQTRTIWSGRGQIAFLATALRGDELAVYWVSERGAEVFGLDARDGRTWPITGRIEPLARDFSYDRDRDEIVFARAAHVGAADYEIVRVGAHSAAQTLRVVFRGASDHLMPRVLRDGRVAFSPVGDSGLALLVSGGVDADRFAPLGEGTDAVLGESSDGRWLAVRHQNRDREDMAIVQRASSASVTISRADRLTEFVGFVDGSWATGGQP